MLIRLLAVLLLATWTCVGAADAVDQGKQVDVFPEELRGNWFTVVNDKISHSDAFTIYDERSSTYISPNVDHPDRHPLGTITVYRDAAGTLLKAVVVDTLPGIDRPLMINEYTPQGHRRVAIHQCRNPARNVWIDLVAEIR